MILGVTAKEETIIKNILKGYKDYSFYYYGSRVKGKFDKTSDLDILIKGQTEIPLSVLSKIKDKFDGSKLPYIVNFCDIHGIDETFYNHIKNDLRKIEL